MAQYYFRAYYQAASGLAEKYYDHSFSNLDELVEYACGIHWGDSMLINIGCLTGNIETDKIIAIDSTHTPKLTKRGTNCGIECVYWIKQTALRKALTA